MNSQKKAMLWRFLVSTIIGIIVFGAILIKACSIIPLGIDYKNEELKKITDGIDFLNKGAKMSKPQVLRLESTSMLFLVQKGKEDVKFISDETYIVKRPSGCSLEFTCLCYCEKSDENEEDNIIEYMCKSGRMNCEFYKNEFRITDNVSNFFGQEEDLKYKFENGFMLSRDLEDQPEMDYRISLKLQKTSMGMSICMKPGLCFDDYVVTGPSDVGVDGNNGGTNSGPSVSGESSTSSGEDILKDVQPPINSRVDVGLFNSKIILNTQDSKSVSIYFVIGSPPEGTVPYTEKLMNLKVEITVPSCVNIYDKDISESQVSYFPKDHITINKNVLRAEFPSDSPVIYRRNGGIWFSVAPTGKCQGVMKAKYSYYDDDGVKRGAEITGGEIIVQ